MGAYEVIAFFADITKAPQDVSGYITNGSTEGSLYGLYLARKRGNKLYSIRPNLRKKQEAASYFVSEMKWIPLQNGQAISDKEKLIY